MQQQRANGPSFNRLRSRGCQPRARTQTTPEGTLPREQLQTRAQPRGKTKATEGTPPREQTQTTEEDTRPRKQTQTTEEDTRPREHTQTTEEDTRHEGKHRQQRRARDSLAEAKGPFFWWRFGTSKLFT